MKTTLYLLTFLCFLLITGTRALYAQDSIALPSENELKVRERTVLGQFESDMVLTADARLKKKLERRDLITKRRSIIDTLDISDRRRRRLLKELYNSPFSNRWEKLVATMEFKEDPDQE
ncbi:MAG: hypothetical protein OEQ81_08300 [Flavobacteriaceae bacterium]|nr:hypothetical protein [Flavobacteriaceae bacterium]